MSQLGALIEEVLLDLEGYIEDQDVFGTLHASIASGDLTFTIDGAVFPDGSGFSPGILEIGDELVYVQAINKATGIATGVLRGWRGTTATAWPAGTLVRNNPRFPRIAVKRAINNTLKAMYPRVYAIKSTEFMCQAARIRYDLPADVAEVLDVSWSVPGPTRSWENVRRWDFDRNAPSVTASGRALEIVDALPGRTVQVTYQAEPAALSNLTDEFTTVTGLPDWCEEIVVIGACWRLIQHLDAGTVGTRTAEQRLINGQVPIGSGVQIAKQYAQMFELRMEQAAERLRQDHDVRVRYQP